MMEKCDFCGHFIAFGPLRHGPARFCNRRCLNQARHILAADFIPNEVAEAYAWTVFQGDCPRCAGPGPIDVRPPWFALSQAHYARQIANPMVCCTSCRTKLGLARGLVFALIGWLFSPIGWIMFPAQIVRGTWRLTRGSAPPKPSRRLVLSVKLSLARRPPHPGEWPLQILEAKPCSADDPPTEDPCATSSLYSLSQPSQP